MKLVVLSGVISVFVVLAGTPLLIRLLLKHGYSQAIRVSTVDLPYPEHEGKRGTPSMGGVAIIAAVVLGYRLTHLIFWTRRLQRLSLCSISCWGWVLSVSPMTI